MTSFYLFVLAPLAVGFIAWLAVRQPAEPKQWDDLTGPGRCWAIQVAAMQIAPRK